MRRSTASNDMLDTRARMADWMIEVFTVYTDNHGSNEYTYFKALLFLDVLIDKGLVTDDNMHIFGIAVMYLGSNLLDKVPMTLENANRDLAHKQFTTQHILKYVNKAIDGLDFNFRMPTWIEYLDKVIFNTFGDYRDHIAEFSIRQTAVFALHACAYDVKWYGQEPFYFVTVVLLYAINCFFHTFDTSVTQSSLDQTRAKSSREEIVAHILSSSGVNKTSVKQSLQDLNEYLETIKSRVQDSTFKNLSNLFAIDTKSAR